MRTLWGRARGFVLPFLATLSALFVFLWPVLLPFSVYRTGAYDVAPADACPGEPVRVIVERSIEHPTLLGVRVGAVREATVVSEWRKTDGTTVPAGEASVPLAPQPWGKVVSPVLREAPAATGEYRLISRTTVSGRVWWADRNLQEFEQASGPLAVKEDCGA